MKPAVIFCAVSLVLSGCAPLSIYYKPGATVSRLQSDTTACEVSALRDAPVATQIRRGPAQYYPGERVCNAQGTCIVRPGYWIPGDIYTVDVNQGLRGRVLDQCMARKGYQPVSVPPCPNAVANAAPARRTATLPQLTASSCVIRNRDGSWQIVNRG